MSINEKIIFDFNIFYENCLQTFNLNPIIVAQRLVIASELYNSLTDKSIKLSDFSDEELVKLAESDNIYDTFFDFWVDNHYRLTMKVEETFAEMMVS